MEFITQCMASGVPQDVFGLLRVLVQLVDEGLGALEFLNLSNARFEGYFKGRSVKIGSLVIEEVNFHSRCTFRLVEGGARSDVNHGRPALRIQCSHLPAIGCKGKRSGGIDPFGGQQLVGFFRCEVRSGIAQFFSAAIPMYDGSSPTGGMTEEASGFCYGAVLDSLTDLGAGHRDFAFDVRRDVLDVEAKSFAAGFQQFHISFSSCSETVVMSHDNGGGAQALYQNFPNEFFRPKARKCAVERLNDQVVQAGFRKFLDPLVEGLNELQPAIRPEQHLSRMRVKGEYDGLRILSDGLFHHPIQQCAVSEMNPVKGAGGDNALAALSEAGKSSVCQHWGKFRLVPV